ncbi:MAG: hypothetical protein A3I66_10795 [Burkholderiales bacterium RIFCSPLOWO2_02_FULL_57_36]|nr:MAG: hypothetical protein A3I66_10795 [Burkholderiales bacterium RIFCSPLOWO2_02_FULL_57_36]
MNSENEIQLSGPFSIFDSSGRTWEIKAIRIFDESYGIIDVYVDVIVSMEDEPLYEDPLVVKQLLARLRFLGYAGPDFGPGDRGLQDDKLIVLEAGEEFGSFAASKGWKNLAEAYVDDEDADDSHSRNLFSALMQKLQVK